MAAAATTSSSAYKKTLKLAQRNKVKNTDLDWTPFRAAEKYYKSRFPPPDLSDVVDFNNPDPTTSTVCKSISLNSFGSSDAFIFPDIPGLVILPAYLSHEKQRHLIKWALSQHACHPNETNLDAHYDMPLRGLWDEYLHSPQSVIQPKASQETRADPNSGPRQLVSNEPASPETYQMLVSQPKPPPAPSSTVPALSATELLPKLRWANIGWSYHWGSKQYDFTKGPGTIDKSVWDLCREVVRLVSWKDVFGSSKDNADWGASGPDWDSWNETYEPDAGIVNFYQLKDTLMGHVDRSEVCATSPLVSISLGNSAVFLIGGLTRETKPTPILLRSGDVIIMAGPACRRAYHGVPRILENTLPAHLHASFESAVGTHDQDTWKLYAKYMNTTRININVRQVFPKGFNPISDHT